MTGLKSGSGDDLWGDADEDGAESSESSPPADDGRDDAPEDDGAPSGDGDASLGEDSSGGDRSSSGQDNSRDRAREAVSDASTHRSDAENPEDPEIGNEEAAGDDDSGIDTSSIDAPPAGDGSNHAQPYVVRRAIQDKSVQFERDERLTFFVHDDVAEGERDLIADVETALGRDVPTFDVREAVYRAALRHPETVLEELVEMGYALEDD